MRIFMVMAVLLLTACASKGDYPWTYTAGWVISQKNFAELDGTKAEVVGCLTKRGNRAVLIQDCSMQSLMQPSPVFSTFGIELITNEQGELLEIPERCFGNSAVVHGVINIPAIGAVRWGMNQIEHVNIGYGDTRSGTEHWCYPTLKRTSPIGED
jgi:hypothetical protein